MITLLLMLLVTSFTFAQNDYSIIFVHLGQNVPEYLSIALAQSRLFNQSAPIYLIVNKNAQFNRNDRKIINEHKIELRYCEELPISSAHEQFNATTTLDNKLRDGFWRKATERFFCIAELMEKEKLKHVFHLETDNMLYCDLEELLPVFNKYENIAAVFDNDNRCIPSFIYFAHHNAIHPLIHFIATKAKVGLNDMEIISRYKQEYGLNAVNHLPIIPDEYSLQFPLQNARGHGVKESNLYSFLCNEFNSLFDGAALGQYLGGIDPRCGISKPGFINESCIFNPINFTFEWQSDERGRNIPYLIFNTKKYRINNLHIHSKNLIQFKS